MLLENSNQKLEATDKKNEQTPSTLKVPYVPLKASENNNDNVEFIPKPNQPLSPEIENFIKQNGGKVLVNCAGYSIITRNLSPEITNVMMSTFQYVGESNKIDPDRTKYDIGTYSSSYSIMTIRSKDLDIYTEPLPSNIIKDIKSLGAEIIDSGKGTATVFIPRNMDPITGHNSVIHKLQDNSPDNIIPLYDKYDISNYGPIDFNGKKGFILTIIPQF